MLSVHIHKLPSKTLALIKSKIEKNIYLTLALSRNFKITFCTFFNSQYQKSI